MHVRIQPDGNISRHFPEKEIVLELEENSTLVDLFDEIGRSIGSNLPESIWNKGKSRFRGPIIIASGGAVLRNHDEVLHDGQLIKLKRFLVGG